MSFTNLTKNSSSFTNSSKNSSSFINSSKNSSVFSNSSKNSTSWDDRVHHLLQEIGDFLLQESGGKIVLQESLGHIPSTTWGNLAKS